MQYVYRITDDGKLNRAIQDGYDFAGTAKNIILGPSCRLVRKSFKYFRNEFVYYDEYGNLLGSFSIGADDCQALGR